MNIVYKKIDENKEINFYNGSPQPLGLYLVLPI